MPHEVVDGTASEREKLLIETESREANTTQSVGSDDATEDTGQHVKEGSDADRESDPIPQFLHWVEQEPGGQHQSNQLPYEYAAPPGYHYGYPYYPPYPPLQGGTAGNEATNGIPPGGYGSMYPAYAQPQQQHYAASGSQHQQYAPPPPPLYSYYPTPPHHQFADHAESANATSAHMYYDSPYSSTVNPMMWSQGSSGTRPPTVPSTRNTKVTTKPHRRVRSSSPLASGRKIPGHEQHHQHRASQHNRADDIEQGTMPSERRRHRHTVSNRVRASSADHNTAEYEIPLEQEDEYHSVPFLGKYRDGTSYGGAKTKPSTMEKLHHRRVRSEEPSTEAPLVRFREEVEYGATSSNGAPSNLPTPPPPAVKQQHPLLRKPRRASAGPSIKRPSLERNQSYEDLRRSNLKKPAHRRVSSESGLPPVGPRVGRHHRRNSSRSSGGYTELSGRGRADSASSVVSTVSIGSIVTDITKSALFGGVTESGLVQFHLPQDNINLIMDPELTPGTILKHREDDEEECFLEYHMVTSGDANWQSLLDDERPCACTCDNCIHCTAKTELLPTVRYALVVEDDVYRRVMKEVSDSKLMPCGLFFCGHHEDVNHPSIFIAVFIVVCFLLGMLAVACLPT